MYNEDIILGKVRKNSEALAVIQSQTYITEKAKTVDVNNALALKANQSSLDTTNANVTANTNAIATHTSQIASLASGTPKGVYTNLVAVTSAFPSGNSNIYITSGNGHWCYWSGSVWTDGGVYQSTGLNSTDDSRLKYNGTETIITTTYTTGYYYGADNVKNTHGLYEYSNPIQLLKGETIVANGLGENSNVAMLLSCNSDGTNPKCLITYTGTQKTSCYTALSDMYIIFCTKISGAANVYKYANKTLANDIFDLNGKFSYNTGLTVTNGQYITTYGSVGTHASYSYATLTLTLGETIDFVANIINANAISVLSFYDENWNFIENLLTGVVGNNSVSYTASKTINLKVSYVTANGINLGRKNIVSELSNVLEQRISESENNIQNLSENKSKFGYIFEDVVCIGDSLTEGDYGQSTVDISHVHTTHNYPWYIAKMSEWNIINQGHSGWYPSLIWTNVVSTYNYANTEAVILWLGTNQGLTDTLVADTNHVSYLDYANTETGYYCKIIEKIKNDNPICKIFLCNIFTGGGGNLATTNSVINQIATKYSLPVINMNTTEFSGSNTLYHPYDVIHFGSIGYLHVADYIYKAISDNISNNEINYQLPLV